MSKLDQHESDVRGMHAVGHTNLYIAGKLGVGEATVRRYLKKLGLETNRPTAQPVEVVEVSREEQLDQENRELRSRLAAQRKQTVREERVTSAIEQAVLSVRPARTKLTVSRPKPDKKARHRHLLVLSDWHGGERVEREQVNGLNSYSWDIMLQRVDEVIDATLSHKEHSPSLTGLDVLLVGDMCSGSNHEELAVTNEFPLAEQGVRVGHVIADTIERLAPHYGNVRVGSVVGNHPRLVKKPAAKNVHDNMDWVASLIAKERLRHVENVDVTVGGHALFWEIAGLTLYVWHGDGIRSSMPGVPWGGVMRRTNEIRRAHSDRRIDGWVYGHFHQCNVMADLGLFGNGALKGTDEYSLKAFGGGSKPSQLLLEFDEKRSRLAAAKMITPTAGLTADTVQYPGLNGGA